MVWCLGWRVVGLLLCVVLFDVLLCMFSYVCYGMLLFAFVVVCYVVLCCMVLYRVGMR